MVRNESLFIKAQKLNVKQMNESFIIFIYLIINKNIYNLE